MGRQLLIGRTILAIAFIGFALQHLGTAIGSTVANQGPPWLPGHPVSAGIVGALLMAAGIGLVVGGRSRALPAALAVMLALYAFALYLPGMVQNIHAPGGWTNVAELLSLSGALLAAARPLPGVDALYDAVIGMTGRLLYGVPLLVFAAQHIIYAGFVSGIVPSWIPWHLFWTYFVAAVFIAAALSIVAGPMRWWAATLLGVQFLLWVPLVHIPLVLQRPASGNEWSSLFVAMAMWGGAWSIAGASRRPGAVDP